MSSCNEGGQSPPLLLSQCRKGLVAADGAQHHAGAGRRLRYKSLIHARDEADLRIPAGRGAFGKEKDEPPIRKELDRARWNPFRRKIAGGLRKEGCGGAITRPIACETELH